MADIIMEQMILGAALSAASNNNDEVENLRAKVANLTEVLDAEQEELMKARAARDGFRELSSAIIQELKQTEKPRYLSDPNNRAARQAFFDEKKKDSYRLHKKGASNT